MFVCVYVCICVHVYVPASMSICTEIIYMLLHSSYEFVPLMQVILFHISEFFFKVFIFICN